MATSGYWNISWASGYWSTASNTKYYHWYGNWSKSGNTITLSGMGLYMTFTHSNSYGHGIADVVQPTGGGRQTVTWSFDAGSQSNIVGVNNSSFSVSSTATSATIQLLIDGETTGSTTISFDASVTAPTGLSASNVIAGPDSFTATVSVTGWGGAGNASNRYRELQVWTYNNSLLVTPNRYERVYGNDLSGSITVTNSSTHGSLTIVPNTRYVLGIYATNGTASTKNNRVRTYVTLAPYSSVSGDATAYDTIEGEMHFGSHGGFYNTTSKLQIDWAGGSRTETIGTSSRASAQSYPYTLSGLEPNTTYYITALVTTTAGTSTGNTITITTPAKPTSLYGSVNGQAKSIKKLYGSVNGQTKKITKLYGSVNGQTKLIFTGS